MKECQRCKICSEKENKALAVDHCHSTGLIRGLLCSACNVALGKFKEKSEIVKKALDYLTQFDNISK